MPTGSLEHVLGRNPVRSAASGIVAGILFVLAIRLAFDAYLLLPALLGTLVIVVILGGGAVLIVLTAVVQRGGLVPAWFGVAPAIATLALRAGTAAWPTAVLVSGLVTGALYLGLSIGVYSSPPRISLPPTGDGDGADAGDREPDTGQASVSRSETPPGSRRRALLWSSGALTLGVAWFAHEYGWTCRASPADCTVENSAPRPVAFAVTVERHGLRIFRETGTLGTIEGSRFHDGASLEPRSRSFRRAVPIGCRLPRELRVTVTTDEYGSVSERVTIPRPAPPETGTVAPATLAIEIGEDGIVVEPRHSYGVP